MCRLKVPAFLLTLILLILSTQQTITHAQVTCEGEQLEVLKRDKFWGQGDNLLGPLQPGEVYSSSSDSDNSGSKSGSNDSSSSHMPLGQLEFLLDPNARRSRGKIISSGSSSSSSGASNPAAGVAFHQPPSQQQQQQQQQPQQQPPSGRQPA